MEWKLASLMCVFYTQLFYLYYDGKKPYLNLMIEKLFVRVTDYCHKLISPQISKLAFYCNYFYIHTIIFVLTKTVQFVYFTFLLPF